MMIIVIELSSANHYVIKTINLDCSEINEINWEVTRVNGDFFFNSINNKKLLTLP